MNRRGFFKSLGIATAAVVITPQLLIPKEPEIPTINLTVYTRRVEVGTRKIRCEWTQEMITDLERQKSIEELSQELNEYMSSLKFEYR